MHADAQPIESEVEVHAQVASVLTKSASIIRELDEYKGAGASVERCGCALSIAIVVSSVALQVVSILNS